MACIDPRIDQARSGRENISSRNKGESIAMAGHEDYGSLPVFALVSWDSGIQGFKGLEVSALRFTVNYASKAPKQYLSPATKLN